MTAFPVGVELEIDGTWTDVSQRAHAVPPTIHRGRPDEASVVAPTTATVVFDNTDGFVSPRNPVSPWYPHIKRGLPCRLSVEAGNPYLLLSGAAGGRATTPDNAALDITADLFMAVELAAPVSLPAPAVDHQLMAKWDVAGGQRSYYLALDEFGRVHFLWSTNGTSTLIAPSTYSLPMWTAGPVALAAALTVNIFGVAHAVTFWAIHGTLADLVTAITADSSANQLGAPFTGSGTTSVFAGTAPLEIGDITGTSGPVYPGGVRRAQVRSGNHTGTVVANPDFTAQSVGSTGFTDSAGRVWAVQGDAKITNKQHRFVGTVDAISLGWPKATARDATDLGVAQATVTVAGELRRFQQGAKPLQSSLRRLISSPSVASNIIAYWPCEDGTAAKSLAAVKGRPMRLVQNVDAGSDSTLAASEALPHVAGGDVARYTGVVPSGSSTAWVVEMVFRIPTPAVNPDITRFLTINTLGTARQWRFAINDTLLRVDADDLDGTSLETQSANITAELFEHWVLFRIAVTQNGGNIDWSWTTVPIPEHGFSPGGGGDSGSFVGTMGRVTAVGNIVRGPGTDGFSFGHIVVQSGLGLGWMAGADTAWATETAAHRVWRLCREEQIPVAVVGDNTMTEFFRGNTELSEPMGPQRPDTLPNLLQECADVDLGILYEQRGASGLAFRTHRSLYNQLAAVTLDLAQRGLAEPFEPVLDDQRLRNDVTVTCVDESSAQIVDQESIDAEDRYDEEFTLNLGDENQCPSQASWRLHLGTWPELRLPAIGMSLLAAGPAVTAKWLDADLGDRLVASNLMRQYDRDTALLLEGYDETLSFFGWDAAMIGSPAGPWEVMVLEDAARGKLDTAGSELASAITTTTTSLSVATTLGPLWSDVNTEDGFDINVGGEQMTVTDISGTSSPQTFTVVRSVNGVVKAHSSGADVRFWRIPVLAL